MLFKIMENISISQQLNSCYPSISWYEMMYKISSDIICIRSISLPYMSCISSYSPYYLWSIMYRIAAFLPFMFSNEGMTLLTFVLSVLCMNCIFQTATYPMKYAHCFGVLCFGFFMGFGGSMWIIYPFSLGLLHWYWVNWLSQCQWSNLEGY